MTTEQFKAYCAELAAKLQDGRALEEAQARLVVSRMRNRQNPEELATEWHDGASHEDWA
jgi:hypothetical protein